MHVRRILLLDKQTTYQCDSSLWWCALRANEWNRTKRNVCYCCCNRLSVWWKPRTENLWSLIVFNSLIFSICIHSLHSHYRNCLFICFNQNGREATEMCCCCRCLSIVLLWSVSLFVVVFSLYFVYIKITFRTEIDIRLTRNSE